MEVTTTRSLRISISGVSVASRKYSFTGKTGTDSVEVFVGNLSHLRQEPP